VKVSLSTIKVVKFLSPSVDLAVGVLLLVLLDYGGLFFYFFSMFWKVSLLEKVPEGSRRPVLVGGRDLGRASTVVFLEARYAFPSSSVAHASSNLVRCHFLVQ
jgi:hypothetical protein